MENNEIIHENPNKNITNKGVAFANSNTPGFLVSSKKKRKEDTVESIKLEPQTEPTDPLFEKASLLRPQSIDVIEEATNEFGNVNLESATNISANVKEYTPEISTNSSTTHDVSETELTNNPSSIFNISLITPETQSSLNHKTINLNDNEQQKIEKSNDNINAEPVINPDIDYFTFDFSTTNIKVEDTETPKVEAVIKTSDDIVQVDFNSVIRPSDNNEVIPDQSNRIELNKFLEPRENIIKKPEEVSEYDNNVIRINDDSTSNFYRSKNTIIKYSLYSFYILLAILLLIFLYRIYKNNTGFALTRNEITLAINSTYQAEIVSNSKIQDNSKYSWSSSNTDVVTVDQNGLITSVGDGEAIITVRKSSQEKTLKVTTVDIKIESITFEQNLIKLKVGEEKTLQPIINNDKTIVIDLLWESSDESIITVDQQGHVSAVGAGSASIYVYDEISGLGGEIEIVVEPSKNSSNKEEDNKDNNKDNIPVTGIALNKSDTIMSIGQYIVVSAVVRPANATNKSVTWTSSNRNIATVSSTGKITAKNVGTATITATTKNGKKASIKITVTEKFIKVTSISLNKESVSLEVGESITLKATVKPDNATNKGIIWTSSDEAIAKVSSNGKVTAKSAGTATITATTKDGNKKDVTTITVKEKEIIAVTSISLNTTSLELDVGGAYTLTATVKPDNASNKGVTWTSSNTNIATVDNGKVVAKSAGTAIITATTKDGNKVATCTVTVKEKIIEATSVSLNKTSLTLTVGETFQLIATINPSNVTDKTLTWKSSKSSYAEVSNTGLVTAKKAGTVVITVKTSNGKKRTCSITIVEPESSTETTQ